MARAQAQYLRIFSAAGATFHRWQSYYTYRNVTWDNASWQWVQFSADGFTAGASGDETNLSVSAPATPLVTVAFEAAIRDGSFVEVSTYEFDANAGNQAPQDAQQLVASVVAQVVGASGTATSLSLQLGSALSPIGAQFPPRTFTTAIMGVGCRL